MNWKQLISNKRFGLEELHEARKDDRSEFQRDYDRLIFSAPFRRLQNKTQVFPLPGSIFVHNRLTHSLEVSCVGRSLGNDVASRLLQKHPELADSHISEIGSIVSAACLAHDLGNPPFGHSGEKAISTYFSEGKGIALKEELSSIEWDDLIHFEGNANAFRLLTHQFEGEQPLQQALQAQQTVLEQQAAHLAAAMQFCADLARQRPQAETLDVDACLTRMEKPAVQGAFCSGWLQDYRTLAQVQHQRHFSFIPEGSINTPQEFTAALQTYAKANGMQFSLEKEGMYPEFSLDGIPYKAYRNPGKYRDEICCDAVHPEQLDTGLPSRRERQLRALRILLPAAFTFAAILAAGWIATGGTDWLWLAALAAAGVLLGRCF